VPTDQEHTPGFTRALQQGEERSFDLLFRKYYAPLCLFANSYLHQEDEAKDLVQDCFIRLWENHSLADQHGSIQSFLYTVVRNKCIDILRQKKTLAGTQETLRGLTPEWEAEEFCEVTRAETIRRIHSAIESLPAKMQRIFRMYYLEGKKYAEIAGILGIHYDTVRQQKARALELLKGRLGMVILLMLNWL